MATKGNNSELRGSDQWYGIQDEEQHFVSSAAVGEHVNGARWEHSLDTENFES